MRKIHGQGGAMKSTFEEVKADIEKQHWPTMTPADWFAFLAKHGWTGQEFRFACNEQRWRPMPPCALCEEHHDTVEQADACEKLALRTDRAIWRGQ
jgi:hypothetical protein